MTRGMKGTFPARLDALPSIKAFMGDVCGAAGVARDDCLRLTLLVEELFTNTVRHGHGGDSDTSVHLTIEPAARAIRVIYEDAAPPHDPFARVARPGGAEPADRPVGGLGVFLVTTMASAVAYAYADGHNRVAFEVPRS